MADSFGYARVGNDAFSDIDDVSLRNKRILQDIQNQKKNFEMQKAKMEFDAWNRRFDPNGVGYYDKGLATQKYGKQTPFVGSAPSVNAGLSQLGILPNGKLTFGTHGSNVVMPIRNKRMMRTDSEGNPTPVSDDEKVLIAQATKENNAKAAMEASSPSAVNEIMFPVEQRRPFNFPVDTQGTQAAPQEKWYNFIKNPQYTEDEKRMIANQMNSRDASIAAALMKPIIYPEADTMSEAMSRLAQTDAGLANSAMGNYLKRQEMAGSMYGSAANLATNFASNSLQAQTKAEENFSASRQNYDNAKVYEDMAKALYSKMPKEMQDDSRKPNFIEVVESKYNKEMQDLAREYDANIRTAEMYKNSGKMYEDRGNTYVGKAKSFMEGAGAVNRDWELGLDFGGIPQSPMAGLGRTPANFASQGDIGFNAAGGFAPFLQKGTSTPSSAGVGTAQAPSEEIVPKGVTGAYGGASPSAGGKLSFDPATGKVVPSKKPSARPSTSKDQLTKSFEDLTREYYDIGKFGVAGSYKNLDTQVQRKAKDDNWVRKVNGIKQELAQKLKDNSNNFSKYAGLYKAITSGNQFGDTSELVASAANPPKAYNLDSFDREIMINGGENWRNDLQELYTMAKNGVPITKEEVDLFNKLLEADFQTLNAKGEKKPLLQQNGLKLKVSKAKFKDDEGKDLYFVDMQDSFI